MEENGSQWKKIAGLIGFIASVLGIYAFVSGNESLSDAIGKELPTPTILVSQAQAFAPPPVESPSSGYSPPATESPPPPSAEAPRLSGSPRDWMVHPGDLPAGMVLIMDREYSNEDVAEAFANPSEMRERLEGWQRVSGYQVGYQADDADDTCIPARGVFDIYVGVAVHHSVAGADGYLDFLATTDRVEGFAPYRLEESDVVGDRAFSAWYELVADCARAGGSNDDWISYSVRFRRYNALGMVRVLGVPGKISPGELEEIGVRLAGLVDLKLVAQGR